MNKQQIILCLGFSVFFSSAALAAEPPKKSANFSGNYKTLTQDQKATPQTATCIATGYDLVKLSKKFDRLGFTQNDIAKVKIKKAKSSASQLTVHGQARNRTSSQWQDIALHCTLKNGAVTNIKLGE